MDPLWEFVRRGQAAQKAVDEMVAERQASMMLFLGVDVGKDGGIAIIDQTGGVLKAERMPATDRDILDLFFWVSLEMPLVPFRAVIEKVHASPQMGVTSAFSFGGSYHALRMALTAARIPFDEVSPMKWQRQLDCLSGGDKRVTLARAKQLFPHVKVTHYVSDALLLAEFCRRTHWVTSDGSKPVAPSTSPGAGAGSDLGPLAGDE
jgi:hypothetical protein